MPPEAAVRLGIVGVRIVAGDAGQQCCLAMLRIDGGTPSARAMSRAAWRLDSGEIHVLGRHRHVAPVEPALEQHRTPSIARVLEAGLEFRLKPFVLLGRELTAAADLRERIPSFVRH